MTLPLHIYRQIWFHKTYDGVNWSSSCWVTVSARIWVPGGIARTGPMDQWPCRCTYTGQDGSTEHKMSKSFQWLWSYSIRKNFGGRHGPEGSMTMPLHTYKPRQLYRTLDGANKSSGCWVTVSATQMGGWTDRWKETILQSPLLSFRKAGDKNNIATLGIYSETWIKWPFDYMVSQDRWSFMAGRIIGWFNRGARYMTKFVCFQ